MNTRWFLAAGLIAALGAPGRAQEAKPADPPAAAAKPNDAAARRKEVVGTYKSETPGAPKMELKLEGDQLILAADGYPPLPVTLNEKDELIPGVALEGFKFSLLRDKEGRTIAVKLETPMGTIEAKRVGLPTAKKSSVPDILGKYAPDQPGPVGEGEIVWQKGKLILTSEGQPEHVITLGKGDVLTGEPAFPENATVKLRREGGKADGKVVGIDVELGDGTKLSFTRKTFPKPPADEAPAPSVPDVLGHYEPDVAGIQGVAPGDFVFEKGKLLLRAEGESDREITVGKDDSFTANPGFPDGVTAKFTRDKDGKVTGIKAETPVGAITWTRKTFVKPPATPGAEEKKPASPEEAKLARLKGAEGTYKSEAPGVPTVTMKVMDGKLFLEAEGFPALEVTLNDKDELKGEMLPPGFELSLIRDKDGKVTGLKAITPMGEANFTRTPPAK